MSGPGSTCNAIAPRTADETVGIAVVTLLLLRMEAGKVCLIEVHSKNNH
jgi:hypothetical protein